jgi:hypothetical protein
MGGNNMKEISFLYHIVKPCGNGIHSFTNDPQVAQQASENGCIVTCKMMGTKVFK